MKDETDKHDSNDWMKEKVFDILVIASMFVSVGVVMVYAWHNYLEDYFTGKFIILYYAVLMSLLFIVLVFYFHLLKIAVLLEVKK